MWPSSYTPRFHSVVDLCYYSVPGPGFECLMGTRRVRQRWRKQNECARTHSRHTCTLISRQLAYECECVNVRLMFPERCGIYPFTITVWWYVVCYLFGCHYYLFSIHSSIRMYYAHTQTYKHTNGHMQLAQSMDSWLWVVGWVLAGDDSFSTCELTVFCLWACERVSIWVCVWVVSFGRCRSVFAAQIMKTFCSTFRHFEWAHTIIRITAHERHRIRMNKKSTLGNMCYTNAHTHSQTLTHTRAMADMICTERKLK